MKKIILSVHLFLGIICFSQTAESINNTRVSQQTYNSQVSNYQRERALDQMEASAKASKSSEMKDLDEKFELNFVQKEKLDSKNLLLNKKKLDLQSKYASANSEDEKQKISKKLKEIDVELEGNMNKLKANEDELKMLQDKYNHIKNKKSREISRDFLY